MEKQEQIIPTIENCENAIFIAKYMGSFGYNRGLIVDKVIEIVNHVGWKPINELTVFIQKNNNTDLHKKIYADIESLLDYSLYGGQVSLFYHGNKERLEAAV